MSVMIAVRHKGKIALAVDSQWSSGWDISRSVHPKIEQRGDILMTVGPSCGYEWLLWDEIEAHINNSIDWMKKWPAYCMGVDQNSALRRLAVDTNKSAPVLVVWQGRIFKLWPDGTIFEDESGIDVCGCGGNFALAAATVLIRTARSARSVAIGAAEVACELSAGCSPPIVCEVVSV